MHSIAELFRQCFDAGNRMVVVVKESDTRYQVSIKRPDGRSFGVFIKADPIEALREALTDGASERRYRLGIWTNAPEDLFGPFTGS